MAPVITVVQTEPPYLPKDGKGKRELSPPLPAGTRKFCKTCWAGLTISKGAFLFFFLFFKSQTVRPGAERKPETDPERSQKANTNT